MDRIIAATVFNHICELGSMSAAARALGISRPMVSRYLAEMEKWAGSRLIHRSSRRLTVTPAGEEILKKTKQICQLSDDVTSMREEAMPSGTLRIACSHFIGMQIVGPVIKDFLKRYPELRIEMNINNHPVSLIGERIDVAIRITDTPEPGTIARRLGSCVSVVCGSPGYLKTHGTPHHPSELEEHNCLQYSRFSHQLWHFQTEEKGQISVPVKGNFSADISWLLCEAAIADCGLTLVPEIEARTALDNGQLIQILPGFEPRTIGIYGLYMSREHKPVALNLFLTAVENMLSRT